MRMSELTEAERSMLDKLNLINVRFEKNYDQSLWNVCWGYLHNKFNDTLVLDSEEHIIEVLKSVNEQAPRIVGADPNIVVIPEVKIESQKEDRVHRINSKNESIVAKVSMNALF